MFGRRNPPPGTIPSGYRIDSTFAPSIAFCGPTRRWRKIRYLRDTVSMYSFPSGCPTSPSTFLRMRSGAFACAIGTSR